VPSLCGLAIDPNSTSSHALVACERPIVFLDVPHNADFGAQLSRQFAARGTAAKMAVVLRTRLGPFGFACADRVGAEDGSISDRQFDLFDRVAREVLGPILGSAAILEKHTRPIAASVTDLSTLTAAERRIASMVSQGASYKEIAVAFNRSVHTVDHQLRHIRQKLGVDTHAKLVQCLSQSGELDVAAVLEPHLA
jgi:DNA-binding CsgD family transcriptional regulator